MPEESSFGLLLQNGTIPKSEQQQQNRHVVDVVFTKQRKQPPDGGTRAWLVMIASFFCNGILFGVINSYSVLYTEFHRILEEKGSTNPSGEAALVGSLTMGTTFLVSAVSGVLTDGIGLRRTTFLGGLIASSGLLLSSFCLHNTIALYITFGVMYGLGGALYYTPSLAILGHHFQKYLGIVNGIVTAGSSVFTIGMPYILAACLDAFQIEWTLRILALLASVIMLFAFLFKPLDDDDCKVPKKKLELRSAFNMKIFQNPKYRIWILVIAMSLSGYFVPYVYILKFVNSNFEPPVDGKLPVLCIGVTSGLGRIIFGYLADFPKINRIYLQQIAFLTIGVFTMLLPFTPPHFGWLITLSLGMGLFDGCFIALLGPIAFEICGKDGGAQAIGFLLGTCSFPLIIGPFIAGIIYEAQKSYTLPFLLSGIPPVIGAFAMFLTRCVPSTTPSEESSEDAQEATNELVVK